MWLCLWLLDGLLPICGGMGFHMYIAQVSLKGVVRNVLGCNLKWTQACKIWTMALCNVTYDHESLFIMVWIDCVFLECALGLLTWNSMFSSKGHFVHVFNGFTCIVSIVSTSGMY